MFISYVCLSNITCFYFSTDILVLKSQNKYSEIMPRILILKCAWCLCMSTRHISWHPDLPCIIFLLLSFWNPCAISKETFSWLFRMQILLQNAPEFLKPNSIAVIILWASHFQCHWNALRGKKNQGHLFSPVRQREPSLDNETSISVLIWEMKDWAVKLFLILFYSCGWLGKSKENMGNFFLFFPHKFYQEW